MQSARSRIDGEGGSARGSRGGIARYFGGGRTVNIRDPQGGGSFYGSEPRHKSREARSYTEQFGRKSSDHRGQQTGNDSILLGKHIRLRNHYRRREKNGEHRGCPQALGPVG